MDELGIYVEAQNCLEQILQESETSAEYDPSQGMTEQELHNFCRFLYSQLQSKDEEIKHLSSNVMELTQEVRLSHLQQQSVNDEHMAANTSASEKLDGILAELTATKHQLLKTQRELADTHVLLASERAEKQKLKEEKQKYEKERCDLLEEISSLRSDLYSGTKSQQTNRSSSHVNANDGEEDFDGTEESLPEENRKGYSENEKSSEAGNMPQPQSSDEKSSEGNDNGANGNVSGGSAPQTVYHGPSRKGCTYNKKTVGIPIVQRIRMLISMRKFCQEPM